MDIDELTDLMDSKGFFATLNENEIPVFTTVEDDERLNYITTQELFDLVEEKGWTIDEDLNIDLIPKE